MGKKDMQLEYVDLLLVHWPDDRESEGNVDNPDDLSADSSCHGGTADGPRCRLSTWKAMVEIWKSGGARAIGVSNWNTSHLAEMVDSKLPLPAVNQNPFHLYNHQDDVRRFCKKHDILFNGYSPFGVPDWHTFPNDVPAILNHATVTGI